MSIVGLPRASRPVLDGPARQAAPFDALAADYDRTFTDSHLGGLVREAVWRRLDARFAAGDRVLEVNCGTGADACHLAGRGVLVTATDVAPAMVAATVERAAATGVADLVSVRMLDLDRIGRIDPVGRLDGPVGRHDGLDVGTRNRLGYDGLVSNFGGLNCVADLPATLAALGRLLRPGGVAVLGIMGPVVPWEWAWQLSRGRPGAAVRRLRPGGVRWRGLTIRYPSPAALARAARPLFTVERFSGVGVLLPPTDAAPWAARHPRIVDRLAAAERRLDGVAAAAWLADHYVVELRRRPAGSA